MSITTREENDEVRLHLNKLSVSKAGRFVRAIVRTTQSDRYMSIVIPEKLNSKSKGNQKLIFGAVKTAISNAAKFKFSSCVGKDLYSDLLKFELTQVRADLICDE